MTLPRPEVIRGEVCMHDSLHGWADDPDRVETYPETLEGIYATLDLTHEREDTWIDLLVSIANDQVEDPRAAVIALLTEHFPHGPDLARIRPRP